MDCSVDISLGIRVIESMAASVVGSVARGGLTAEYWALCRPPTDGETVEVGLFLLSSTSRPPAESFERRYPCPPHPYTHHLAYIAPELVGTARTHDWSAGCDAAMAHTLPFRVATVRERCMIRDLACSRAQPSVTSARTTYTAEGE